MTFIITQSLSTIKRIKILNVFHFFSPFIYTHTHTQYQQRSSTINNDHREQQEEERAYLNHVNRVVPEYVDDYMFKKIEKPLRQHYAAEYLTCLDADRRFEELD